MPGYFASYAVAEFRFADGTIWTTDTIKTKVTTPTSGADTLIAFESNDSISGLAGNDWIDGREGNDTLDGGLGSDTLFGGYGNDLLIAGTGDPNKASVSNILNGGEGEDVLIGGGNSNSLEQLDGGAGADILLGGTARENMADAGYDGRNSLFFGGAGADTMRMYAGASAIAIGGSGNDIIGSGPGAGYFHTRMIVAFNKSDGADTVDQLAPGSTISIGGTLYSNLSLEVSGSGLRLKTGSNTYVYLSDWYSSPSPSGAGGKSVSTLQIVIEGTRDYKPTSTNPMNNAKIVAFDFVGLVNAFDAARAAGQNFSVANNLAGYRLWSSNTDAIGGAVAYQYAKSGTLGTLTYDQMRGVILAPEFAAAAQPISVSASASAMQELSTTQDLIPLTTNAPGAAAPQRSPIVMPTAGHAPWPLAVSGGKHVEAAQTAAPGQDRAPRVTSDSGAAIQWDQPAVPISPAPAVAARTEEMDSPGAAGETPRGSGLEIRFAALLDGWLARAQEDQPIALSDFDGIRAGVIGNAASSPNARFNEAVWSRVARDLPAHLGRYSESGLGAPAGFANAVLGAGLLGPA
ncbi:MAG: hypothetical protein HYX64_10025, partial [Gammaproteobacteria bacterium]|nr:hypothetical protein [Gammaproteobacteria bacterium]